MIGVRALLVRAESARARGFYEHLAESEPSATDPLHLVLLMKDLRCALEELDGHGQALNADRPTGLP